MTDIVTEPIKPVDPQDPPPQDDPPPTAPDLPPAVLSTIPPARPGRFVDELAADAVADGRAVILCACKLLVVGDTQNENLAIYSIHRCPKLERFRSPEPEGGMWTAVVVLWAIIGVVLVCVLRWGPPVLWTEDIWGLLPFVLLPLCGWVVTRAIVNS